MMYLPPAAGNYRKDTNHVQETGAMEKSDLLRLRDVRGAYRLIGECRELGRDPMAWRVRMLEGLRDITGAQVALAMRLDSVGSGAAQITEPLDVGFLEPSQRALWAHYQRENAHRDDPFHVRYYRDFTGSLRTRALGSVVDMSEWRRSRHYNDYVRACGLDDRITSSIRVVDAHASVLYVTVLHRAASDGPYPSRMERLVHLFHQELRLIIGRQLTTSTVGCELELLAPQLRRVLTCLLEGNAEKEIADRLGLSRYTVNRHVQRLHRRFGVHSRGELMFRCREMVPLLPPVRRSP
jgi:DNA-binding CsgD family transcriptional regulator